MSFASLQASFNALAQPLTTAAPYLAAAAFLLALVSFVLLLFLRRRLRKLAMGRNGSFEETISILSRDMKDIREFRTELEQYLKISEARLQQSVRGVGLVRFNPFQEGTGGNQSFSVAFIDEGGDGVVLSTIYARDRVGVYAKPLEKGVSSYTLTSEEEEALKRARTHAERYSIKKVTKKK